MNSNSNSNISNPPPRRSSRRRTQDQSFTVTARKNIRITAFQPPWIQHYLDVGHCRWQKCTQRIVNASDLDIQRIKISFLAMSITASSAYTPKARQERALMEYTRAVRERGIDPNDYHGGRSAVAAAAYYGYKDLLQLLLDDHKCSAVEGDPNALHAAIMNGQHECMEVLFLHRKEELTEMLQNEANKLDPGVPRRGIGRTTAMRLAIQKADSEAIRLLREKGHALVSDMDGINLMPYLVRALQELYPNDAVSVLSWSRQLHWSFPLSDRQMINYLWHHIRQKARSMDGQILAGELWLRIFSFMGRGWWWRN